MIFTDYFDKTYIVNLPARSDRRADMTGMLKRVGLPLDDGRIEFFPAVRPDSKGEFTSIGARGCFLSHLGVLKRARDAGLRNVLLMEDDLEIGPEFPQAARQLVETLDREEWGFAYFGHALDLAGQSAVPGKLLPYDGPIVLAHFVAFNGPVIPRVIDLLELMLTRPDGHPDGGPQHVDGAYSTFRDQNPDVRTLVAWPSLGGQRSSKSDITTAWFDQYPGLGLLARVARRIKRYF